MGKSREQFEEWLTDLSKAERSAIAVRAGLRAYGFSTVDTVQDEASGATLLLESRKILTAVVGLKYQTPEVKYAGLEARSKIRRTLRFNRAAGTRSPQRARSSFASKLIQNAINISFDRDEPIAIVGALFSEEFSNDIFVNAAARDSEFEIGQLLTEPLWHVPGEPDWLAKENVLIASPFLRESVWDFWREWYQGFLVGKPLNWDLQREVALIPNEEWEIGPKRIAEIIEEIRARFNLRLRIAELEGELALATQSRHSIGGNNPPEPIAEVPAIAKEFTIIWAPLQNLKSEVEAREPDRAIIRKTIELLLAALKAGTVWSASKADLAVDTTIKWAIPVAGTGYLAMNPDKLAAVIEAAQHWLKTIL